MSRPLVVLGASGHAKVVVATARAAGRQVVAAFDDDPAKLGGDVLGVPIVGPLAAARELREAEAVFGIGDNAVRRAKEIELAGLEFSAVVHPHAWVAREVLLGAGCVIFAGAIVQPDSAIGRQAIVNTAASVDHDCRVDHWAHLAPGVRLAGGVTIGEGALLGVGAVVLPGVRVGAWAVVGAGAVVHRDLPEGARVAGVPARPLPETGPR